MLEKLSLKWNDFFANVSKSFSLLREEDYLHDVTLVTDDNNQISAHKIVLSACSEYFKDVFRNNTKHSHPIICLQGLGCEDLKNILDYMYNGEVRLYQDQIEKFLEVARRFKFEGILKSNTVEEKYEQSENIENQNLTSKFIQFDEQIHDLFDEESQDVQLKEENYLEECQEEEITENTATVIFKSSNLEEIEEKLNQYIERCEGGLFRCTLCGRTGKQSRNVKNHIETHIEGLKFPCDKCAKTFRSRHVMYSHTAKIHSSNSFRTRNAVRKHHQKVGEH